jgi:hypothetical protein
MSKVSTCLWFGKDAEGGCPFLCLARTGFHLAVASRAFADMTKMVKLDVAALERAAAG